MLKNLVHCCFQNYIGSIEHHIEQITNYTHHTFKSTHIEEIQCVHNLDPVKHLG
jgi:hypothetical protein